MGDSILASSSEQMGQRFNTDLVSVVSAMVEGRVRLDVPASSITTFAIGGPLRALVTVESASELQAVLSLLRREGQRVFVVGFGSNLVISDDGLNGWIIRLGSGFRAVEAYSEGEFAVGGAASLMSLSRKLSEEGFSGLEFAAGIPASFGGAIFMNAGAHGSEIGSRIIAVSGVMPDGTEHQWKGNDLPWRYRCSGLPEGVVVTGAVVRLARGDRETIAKACADNLAHRRATQPLALPSAGSVFKNPEPSRPAGMVLEQAGLKGTTVGGAQVSTLHANWIVNPERRASAADVRELIELCAARVREHSGIELHPEVKLWG